MANGDGMNHYLHPDHHLVHVYIESDFLCSGCKVEGHGVRYRCHECDFNLHEHCAGCSSTISVRIHSEHLLTLYVLPEDNPEGHRCSVCQKNTTGMCYRCVPCDFTIHPLCTLVPPHASRSRHNNGHNNVLDLVKTLGKITINVVASVVGVEIEDELLEDDGDLDDDA